MSSVSGGHCADEERRWHGQRDHHRPHERADERKSKEEPEGTSHTHCAPRFE